MEAAFRNVRSTQSHSSNRVIIVKLTKAKMVFIDTWLFKWLYLIL